MWYSILQPCIREPYPYIHELPGTIVHYWCIPEMCKFNSWIELIRINSQNLNRSELNWIEFQPLKIGQNWIELNYNLFEVGQNWIELNYWPVKTLLNYNSSKYCHNDELKDCSQSQNNYQVMVTPMQTSSLWTFDVCCIGRVEGIIDGGVKTSNTVLQ